MTDFRPFKAWRYNGEKVAWKEVIAPPYDVISPEEQDELYEVSPYNCIRLILNKEEASDSATDNRYSRAKKFYSDWKNEGILIQESEPAFYLYRQVFKDPLSGEPRERLALFGALHVEDFEKEIVIPHEKTLDKPKRDRKLLIEATESNLSPIFGLYEDPQGSLNDLLKNATSQKPLYQADDSDGIQHTFWLIQDAASVETIKKEISGQKIYIADGHHRYQTALDHSKEVRKQKGLKEDEETGSDFVMMALVSFKDPGLALFPTHRLMKTLPNLNTVEALSAVEKFFEAEESTPEELRAELEKPDSPLTMGLLLEGGQAYSLKLKDKAKARENMPGGHSDAWYDLDVNLVAHLVLASLWNIGENQWESLLQFTHSTDLAIQKVTDGDAAVAFLLKAPKVTVLSDMGKTRELMPQKSTYFYPKLASGLVFFQHESS